MTSRPTDHAHRCQHWTGGKRCDAPATHRFLVNGVPATYAGYTCKAHGEAVIAEYARIPETVGTWTMEALPDDIVLGDYLDAPARIVRGKRWPAPQTIREINAATRQRERTGLCVVCGKPAGDMAGATCKSPHCIRCWVLGQED